jgi:3-deoxy-manno-octulosonate cytidylyltransferase (CMP-KDO synthetase)
VPVSATIAIPARLKSSRLPRKVLADIEGKSMIQRVYEAGAAADAGRVLVLTDSDEVAEDVEGFGGDVMMTSPDCVSGTARVASIADKVDTDLLVNLQGDAPLTDPSVVAQMVEEAGRSGAPVTIPVYRLEGEDSVHDPNVVKVVRTLDGRVLYCSRSPIPYVRDGTGPWIDRALFWGHPGLYSFTREFMLNMPNLPPSPLDQAENLEQLQFLECGEFMHSFEVPKQGLTVDTTEDLEYVRQVVLSSSR